MKRFFILTTALALMFVMYDVSAQSGQQLLECLNKSKSCYVPTAGIFTNPQPFQQTGTVVNDVAQWWPSNQPAISTGYYFVTNRSNAGPAWRPNASVFVDTTVERPRWKSIISGPRQVDKDFWTGPENDEGHSYFRNPANDNLATTDVVEYFMHASDPNYPGGLAIDSTDDAIAGPIKIGLSGARK